MTSCTLKEYKNNYKSNLSAYLKKFEDNTVKSFFSEELEDYKTYHQTLVDLKELILQDYEDVSIPVEVFTHEVSDLKGINEKAYRQFITDEDNTRYLHLIDGKLKDVGPEDSSLVDFDKLKNFIKSSDRIIGFITVQLEKSKLSDNLDFNTPGDDDYTSAKVNAEKSANPHPRIFKNYYAFSVFEKLKAEFGKTKYDLANYSFVYHRMLQDDLIFHDIKQLEYYDFLAKFDIHIERIRGLKGLGKTQLRESIYASAK